MCQGLVLQNLGSKDLISRSGSSIKENMINFVSFRVSVINRVPEPWNFEFIVTSYKYGTTLRTSRYQLKMSLDFSHFSKMFAGVTERFWLVTTLNPSFLGFIFSQDMSLVTFEVERLYCVTDVVYASMHQYAV